MDPIERMLDAVLADVRPDHSGAVADYIPALAAAEPERLAFAVVGPRGRVTSVGDDEVEFTIQSVSKPFVLAHALERLGRDEVFRHVGVEPSGEPFNAISLELGTGRPANPMVNAGAIATSALAASGSLEERSRTLTDALSRFAGRSLSVDEEVYRGESETGHRNRALAHLLRSHAMIDGDVTTAVEAYFRQCSVRVTVVDLAVMAGTLAFGGRNPLTGERVVREDVARDVVSVMASCGMYDYSGEWLLRVGMPAKSGVSGDLLAIAPSQFGIATFSPRLDRHGNSVRGIRILERLAGEFGMHAFEPHEAIAAPGIRVEHTAEGTLVHLGGELAFSGAERVIGVLRDLAAGKATGDGVILVDARELGRAHPAALEVLRTELADATGAVRLLA
ncbi:glutaminase A [Microbacterium sp. LRZ72]|uniref:glutaminase A n=1 Tax=Microbacterium sp. LRZ72 TaxID=2942481 RepID=UPI0029A354A6|nr:glutaminase A [Microbacterium sp. LRZ72]MDX2375399.1 glutaminase A [Microbacterium sp. LRZ72]